MCIAHCAMVLMTTHSIRATHNRLPISPEQQRLARTPQLSTRLARPLQTWLRNMDEGPANIDPTTSHILTQLCMFRTSGVEVDRCFATCLASAAVASHASLIFTIDRGVPLLQGT